MHWCFPDVALSLHPSLETDAFLLEVVGRISAPAYDHRLWVAGKHALSVAVAIGVANNALAIAALHAVEGVRDRLAAIFVDKLMLLAMSGQYFRWGERRAARLGADQYVARAGDHDPAMSRGAAQEGNWFAVDLNAVDALGNRIAAGRAVPDPQSGQVIDQYIRLTAGGGVGGMTGEWTGIQVARREAGLAME